MHQQMCWWCGDHKDNKIIPKPESLGELRSEGSVRAKKAAFRSDDKEAYSPTRARLEAGNK